MRCYGILLIQGERIQESLMDRGVGEKHARRWFSEWKSNLDQGSDGRRTMEETADRFSQLAIIALALVDSGIGGD